MEAAARRRSFLERELAPLADEQVEDARQQAELGEFDALVQLEALSRRFEARMEILAAIGEESSAREEMNGLLGPTWQPDAVEVEDE